MITKIKICGITRMADAEAVIAAGADALGLNFAPVSPRCVDPARAREIAVRSAGAVQRVALFLDAAEDDIRRVLDHVPVDVLQFHGQESGDACRRFGLPYLKVVRVRAPLDMAALEAEYADACALLLDAFVANVPGGTGTRFDWGLWPPPGRLPLILAGGLTPDNVADAVRRLQPWGVDVAGGVEGARKGEKDADSIRRFVAEVHGARR
jgi:phosphoribosylanthranilate isomerase